MPTFRSKTWTTDSDSVINPGLKGKRFASNNFPAIAPGIQEWFDGIEEIAGETVEDAAKADEISRNRLMRKALLYNAVTADDASFVNAYWAPGLDTENGDPIAGGYGNLNAQPQDVSLVTEDSKGNSIASPWVPNLLPPDEPGDEFTAEKDNPVAVVIPRGTEETPVPTPADPPADLKGSTESTRKDARDEQNIIPPVGLR